MKPIRELSMRLALAPILAGFLACPATLKAVSIPDSPEITKLLADVKGEAAELKSDAEDLNTFANSNLSWASHASKIELMKTHINNSGKLLAQMQDSEALGSPWQQTAIRRIEPVLRELAENTERTIHYLNENQMKIHFGEFKDYVKANYELATDLETLIRDFVAYGEAKQKLEKLGEKLEITG